MTRHLSHLESIHSAGTFASTAALKAVVVSGLINNTWSYVESEGEYYYDSASFEAESLPDIIQPASGAGRWYKKKVTAVSPNNILKLLAGKVNLSGGILTGPLTLASDPSSSLQAATKQYVDNAVMGVSNNVSTLVSDAAFSSSWDGSLAVAPSRNALYDKIVTLFSNGGNAFGGNAVLGTNDAFALHLKSNNTVRLSIDPSGTLISQVNLQFAGTHTTPKAILDESGNKLLEFFSASGATNYLQITNIGANPQIKAMGGTNPGISLVTSGTGMVNIPNAGLNLTSATPYLLATSGGLLLGNGAGSQGAISGTARVLSFSSNSSIIAGSGSAIFNLVDFSHTINQTGTANGTVRGIYYNPTVASVLGTHNAIETTSGQVLFTQGNNSLKYDNNGLLTVTSPTAAGGGSYGIALTGTGTGAGTWRLAPTSSGTLLLIRPSGRLALWGYNGEFSVGTINGDAVNNVVMGLSLVPSNISVNNASMLNITAGTQALNTSGTYTVANVGISFSSSSNAANVTALKVTNVINQTGTASGTVRGIYYNPVVTSVLGTHMAFEATSGLVKIADTTNASNNTTGALVVSGGAGIAGNLWVGSLIGAQNSLNITSNGGSISFNVGAGSGVLINKTVVSSSSGAFFGLSISGGLTSAASTATYAGVLMTPVINQVGTANGTIRGIYYNPAITALQGSHIAFEATSGKVIISDTTASSSATTGALTVAGGVGIGGNLNINGDTRLTSISNAATPLAIRGNGGGGSYTQSGDLTQWNYYDGTYTVTMAKVDNNGSAYFPFIGRLSRSGTDIAGDNFYIGSGLGTGTGAISNITFMAGVSASAGTGSHSYSNMATFSSALASFAVPVKVPSYTVAGVPGASTVGAGSIIFIPNESGGATLAFSDGTNWLRVQDRAVIS